MDKIYVDIDQVIDGTALIIKKETGVCYDVQTGGVACNHPMPEGFVISIGQMFQDLNDCDYGCQYIHEDKEAQKRLAKDLDQLFITETKDMTFSLRFNWNELDELQEGFWPVIVSGKFMGYDVGEQSGYIHTGNCD